MGRRKASPTPRGELLGAFIASAHSATPARSSSAQSKASSSSLAPAPHLAVGKPRTAVGGAAAAAAAAATSGTAAAAATAVRSAKSGAHVNQQSTTATAANKDSSLSISTTSTATPILRSSLRKSSSLVEGYTTTTPLESVPNKRQKVENVAPRQSSRLRKLVVDSDPADVSGGSFARQTRSARKAIKPVQQSQPKDITGPGKEAISLLQDSEASNDLSSRALLTPPADPSSDAGSGAGAGAGAAAAAAVEEGCSNSAAVTAGVESEGITGGKALEIREKQDHVTGRKSGTGTRTKSAPLKIEDLISPASDSEDRGSKDKDTALRATSLNLDGGYTTGPAQTSVTVPTPQTLPSLPPPLYVRKENSPPGSAIPTGPSSGSQPATAYTWPYSPQCSSWSMPDVGTHTFINSTKGQKVKGRPLSKAVRQAHNASRARNVANTYPRKQPFKAQIMFDGYPSEDQPMREGLTLWEICQEYPNHLTGKILEGFVQKEWSANELCACLRDDARKVLTDRPGKDKTMVFQKRLERIKKDLIAKNEFDQLMNGPEIRADGRPTWVKRGNVRRR